MQPDARHGLRTDTVYCQHCLKRLFPVNHPSSPWTLWVDGDGSTVCIRSTDNSVTVAHRPMPQIGADRG